jgi:hypothetical protein
VSLGADINCRLGVRGNSGEIILRVEDSRGSSSGLLLNVSSGIGSIGLDTRAKVRVEVDLSVVDNSFIKLYKDDVLTHTWDNSTFIVTGNTSGQINGVTGEFTVMDGNFDSLRLYHAAFWRDVGTGGNTPSKRSAPYAVSGNVAAANANYGKQGADVVA